MTLQHVPDPRLLDWVTWVDSVILTNPRASRVMESRDESMWREVADRLSLLEPTTPRHDDFDDWREWAINLMAVNSG